MKRTLWLLLRLGISGGLMALAFSLVTWWDEVKLADGTVLEGTATDDVESRTIAVDLREGGERTVSFDVLARPEGEPDADDVTLLTQSVTRGFWPGLRRLRWGLFLASMLGMVGTQLVITWRWKVLLASQGMPFGYGTLLYLTFLGNFYNNFMPSLTGGDLFKSWYIAKRARNKTVAVVSVFVDRFIGLFALVLLTFVLLLFMLGREEFGPVFTVLFWTMTVSFGCAVLAFSHTARRWIGLERWIDRIPGGKLLREVDRAVMLYKKRPGAVTAALAMSVVNHLFYSFMGLGFARALGIVEGTVMEFLFLIPLATVIKALPVSIMGLGIGEIAYPFVFATIGVDASAAIALSLVTTIAYFFWNLPGGVLLLFEKTRPSVVEMEETVTLAEGASGP